MAFDQCLSYGSYLVETCKHYERPVVNFTSFRIFAIFALWKRATFLKMEYTCKTPKVNNYNE